MKSSIRNLFALALAAGFATSAATAAVTIDWVTVGYAGNASDPTTGYGKVDYEYQIGKYEVTNAQYTAFLNAVDPNGTNPNGIWDGTMGYNANGGISFTAEAAPGQKYAIKTNMGDKPVNYVSWYDAARFANWLNNGQGSADTETGAYTLSGNTGLPTRNVGATICLPSEDEWYKAAYYDPTPGAGGGDNYWLYATQSDSVPTVGTANATGDISNPGANVANYYYGAAWLVFVEEEYRGEANVTTVGSAGAANFFGTADQAGNVWEWNEAVISSEVRGMRGGAWLETYENNLSSAQHGGWTATDDLDNIGFRVASVPEPSAMVLTILFSAAFCTRRKR